MPPLILDSNIAYVILLVGLWGGVTAAYIPGTGIAEGISALVSIGAIVALASLPTNWLAVVLLVIGVAGFLIMPFINQRLAWLGVGGLMLQAVGSLLLFNGMAVSLPLIVATILLSLVYHQFILMPALAHSRKQTVPDEDDTLIGAGGRVVSPLNPVGTVQAAGELWTARSDRPLDSGDEVIVADREGLVLVVEGVKYKREGAEAEQEPHHQMDGHREG